MRLPESVVLDEPATTTFGGAGNKPLFRTAASKVLPAAVLARKKIGLGAPMARWLRGSLGSEIEEIVIEDARSSESPLSAVALEKLFDRHRTGERDYATYLWSIANVALWRRRWLR